MLSVYVRSMLDDYDTIMRPYYFGTVRNNQFISIETNTKYFK